MPSGETVELPLSLRNIGECTLSEVVTETCHLTHFSYSYTSCFVMYYHDILKFTLWIDFEMLAHAVVNFIVLKHILS